jgi:hypothetical protein
MKIAILLFGMSKSNYTHWSHNHAKTTVDYEKSIDNYKEYIYAHFNEQKYDIDTYIATNIINARDELNIVDAYKPKKYSLVKNHHDKTVSRNMKMCEVIKLCLDSGIQYDLILITRFDLIFKIKFDNSNINLLKLNVVTTHNQNKHICDNFYLLPFNSLVSLYNIVNNDITKMCHHHKDDIENMNGKDYVNYVDDSDKEQQFYEIYRPSNFFDSDKKIMSNRNKMRK